MPAPKGPEWDYLEVITPGEGDNGARVKCKLCDKEFCGGASRIRGHILCSKG